MQADFPVRDFHFTSKLIFKWDLTFTFSGDKSIRVEQSPLAYSLSCHFHFTFSLSFFFHSHLMMKSNFHYTLKKIESGFRHFSHFLPKFWLWTRKPSKLHCTFVGNVFFVAIYALLSPFTHFFRHFFGAKGSLHQFVRFLDVWLSLSQATSWPGLNKAQLSDSLSRHFHFHFTFIFILILNSTFTFSGDKSTRVEQSTACGFPQPPLPLLARRWEGGHHLLPLYDQGANAIIVVTHDIVVNENLMTFVDGAHKRSSSWPKYFRVGRVDWTHREESPLTNLTTSDQNQTKTDCAT